MTYKTKKVIPPHGGYKNLESFKNAGIIYDGTVAFCKRNKSYMTYKTYDQMTGAGRSGKQNIAEGSIVSGTSKKSEIKLISIARGSLGELLEDFMDFLRQNNLPLWNKDQPEAITIRQLAYKSRKSYETYRSYFESNNLEVAVNSLICLINQTNYLLDRQLQALEKEFLEKGGFTENLYLARREALRKACTNSTRSRTVSSGGTKRTEYRKEEK